MDATRYTYRVLWSEEDQEFVGLCSEFPSLSWLAENQRDALGGIVQLVSEVAEEMEANGESIPESLSLKKYSGKISLRTTPDIHRSLTIDAAESGVSINRHINDLLTRQAC